MNYILRWFLFSNEKKVRVFWKLMIEKRSMWTKLNKQKYAHKNDGIFNQNNLQYWIEPPAVSDLRVNTLNETAFQLSWKNPITGTGVFSSLEISCHLQDPFTQVSAVVTESVLDTSTEGCIVTRLTPGALYSCHVATVRTLVSSGVSKRTASTSVIQMTSK